MIDERLNFNQNGGPEHFREVNRLISQALHPPSRSLLLLILSDISPYRMKGSLKIKALRQPI